MSQENLEARVAELALVAALLSAGCSRQPASPPPPPASFESLTLVWDGEIPDAGMTNHCVIVRTVTSAATNEVQTDVDSLDQAANILGKDGWHLVATDSSGGAPTWHLSRQSRDDGKTFTLMLYNSRWNDAKP